MKEIFNMEEAKQDMNKQSITAEEEEEPKLKYERINGDFKSILKKDAASSMYLNEKVGFGILFQLLLTNIYFSVITYWNK